MSSEGPSPNEPVSITVEARAHGWRLDHYLSRLYPNYSRGQWQKAIELQRVLVNGLAVKASRRLRVNDVLSVRLPEEADQALPPEDIPLDVIYEDDSLVVLNKSAGMIVHPGKGNYGGTLAGALQFHFDQLSDAAGKYRAGIVHRLDRDTSGVLVVAKNNQVHSRLSRQFEQRDVEKEYRALVWGVLDLDSDYIETHVRVSQRNRERMVVCPPGGNAREAVTFYSVLERFDGFTLVQLHPKTGRTHQLRVHLQYLGHPIVADRLYGGQALLKLSDVAPGAAVGEEAGEEEDPVLIDRQALHALRLEFDHPETAERMRFEAPLPHDFQRTLEALQKYRRLRK